MENIEQSRRNLYQRRLEKEKAIPESEIQARMRWDMPILSQNKKTGLSLDLPATNCIPTKICSEFCYSSQGTQAWHKSLIKALSVNRLLDLDPEYAARKIVNEAMGRNIRIAGSGEILPKHTDFLSYIERYNGSWHGFTRRVDTHQVLPSLMFSFDQSTPSTVMEYIHNEMPYDRRAYLRRPQDPPSPLEVAVTFPIHGPLTNYKAKTPFHETDCPSEGCWRCQKCY